MEKLLTRGEIASLLHKPESWLRYAERHRLIPFLKVGQHIRYRASEVQEWLDSNKIEPNPSTTD